MEVFHRIVRAITLAEPPDVNLDATVGRARGTLQFREEAGTGDGACCGDASVGKESVWEWARAGPSLLTSGKCCAMP